jgi:hypothetical protein
MILAVKNFGNSHHASVVGVQRLWSHVSIITMLCIDLNSGVWGNNY